MHRRRGVGCWQAARASVPAWQTECGAGAGGLGLGGTPAALLASCCHPASGRLRDVERFRSFPRYFTQGGARFTVDSGRERPKSLVFAPKQLGGPEQYGPDRSFLFSSFLFNSKSRKRGSLVFSRRIHASITAVPHILSHLITNSRNVAQVGFCGEARALTCGEAWLNRALTMGTTPLSALDCHCGRHSVFSPKTHATGLSHISPQNIILAILIPGISIWLTRHLQQGH